MIHRNGKLKKDKTNIYCLFYFILCTDPGFQVRGGGGAHLKKCAERREARTFLGYFV